MQTAITPEVSISNSTVLKSPENERREAFLSAFFAKEPYVRMEIITAEQAGWLRDTSRGNRRQVKSNSQRIAQDMVSGKFYPGDSALMFDTDNVFGNGHHRLDEQIAAGVNITYIVRTHVPKEEFAVIDHGAARNARASLEFLPEFVSKFGTVRGNELTYINAVFKEGGRKQIYLTSHQQGEALLYFKEELDWTYNIIGTKRIGRITHAGTIAPFIRAYRYGHDKNKLTLALKYLVSGPSELMNDINDIPGIRSIYTLREHLLTMKSGAGEAATREIYDKVSRMLNAFLEGVDMSKVSSAKDERFPLTFNDILSPPTDLDKQREILGSELHRALMQWADSAPANVELTPNQIVESISSSGKVSLKPSTMVHKLSKTARELGYIDIPNKGKLFASGPQNVKSLKVTHYEFQKKK